MHLRVTTRANSQSVMWFKISQELDSRKVTIAVVSTTPIPRIAQRIYLTFLPIEYDGFHMKSTFKSVLWKTVIAVVTHASHLTEGFIRRVKNVAIGEMHICYRWKVVLFADPATSPADCGTKGHVRSEVRLATETNANIMSMWTTERMQLKMLEKRKQIINGHILGIILIL